MPPAPNARTRAPQRSAGVTATATRRGGRAPMISSEPAGAESVTNRNDDVVRAAVLIVEDHQLAGAEPVVRAHGGRVRRRARRPRLTRGDPRRVRAVAADIVLLDLDLGATAGDGLGLVGPLRERGARVLVVSGSTDRPRLASCLELGAVGVLPKSTPYELLVAAGHGHRRRPSGHLGGGPPRHATELRAWRSGSVTN